MSGYLYLAGPMSGIPECNYPAFREAAAALRRQGWAVCNPAENVPPNAAPTWEDWMTISRQQVRGAEMVVLLPGWQQSRGACEERDIADDNGIPVHVLRDVLAGEAL
jgi:Domain of unknown function (DUF4406)